MSCLLIFLNQICQCDASQLVLPSKVWISCPFCWTSRTPKHVNHTYLAWFAFRIQFVIPGNGKRMKFHPWKDFLLSFARLEVQYLALGPAQQHSRLISKHVYIYIYRYIYLRGITAPSRIAYCDRLSVLRVGFWARSRFCCYEEVWTKQNQVVYTTKWRKVHLLEEWYQIRIRTADLLRDEFIKGVLLTSWSWHVEPSRGGLSHHPRWQGWRSLLRWESELLWDVAVAHEALPINSYLYSL